jgi:hypothetical protein
VTGRLAEEAAMPITTHAPVTGFAVYYSLVGNNSRPGSGAYRPNNPWAIAHDFCNDASVRRAAAVAAVSTLDDSVFVITLQPGALNGTTVEALATAFLTDLAAAIAPAANGDYLVAIVADNGNIRQIVHHTP